MIQLTERRRNDPNNEEGNGGNLQPLIPGQEARFVSGALCNPARRPVIAQPCPAVKKESGLFSMPLHVSLHPERPNKTGCYLESHATTPANGKNDVHRGKDDSCYTSPAAAGNGRWQRIQSPKKGRSPPEAKATDAVGGQRIVTLQCVRPPLPFLRLPNRNGESRGNSEWPKHGDRLEPAAPRLPSCLDQPQDIFRRGVARQRAT